VRLATDEAAIVNNREIPDICLQHMAAVMVMDKTVTFNSAHDKGRMKDPGDAPGTRQSEIEFRMDQLERLMPLRVAIVEVQLTDGTHLTSGLTNVRGHSQEPHDHRGNCCQGPRFDSADPGDGTMREPH